MDGHIPEHNPIHQRAKAIRKAAMSTLEGARYTEKYLASCGRGGILGKRLLTWLVPEAYMPLPQEEALGHTLYVVGLIPQQYIFCELCNAYSGDRAQNLLRCCLGKRYESQAVARLRRGVHPAHATDLMTQPRRLTRCDVGTDFWCIGRDSTLGEADAVTDGEWSEPAEPTVAPHASSPPHTLGS